MLSLFFAKICHNFLCIYRSYLHKEENIEGSLVTAPFSLMIIAL